MVDWGRINLKPAVRNTGTLPRVRARYDAAQNTPETRKHWQNADYLDAKEANSASVRNILRSRARYQVHQNDSLASGIVSTLVNDIVGTGPRLQIISDDSVMSQEIERRWRAWAESVDLATTLRTACTAKIVDGEAFGMFINRPAADNPVTLDIRLVEADQIATPSMVSLGSGSVDGLVLDDLGYVTAYHMLDEHPGGVLSSGGSYSVIPAPVMLHWFRQLRPGQYRGIPEITTALPLFAQLSEYTQSVISAARSAADMAVYMKTNNPAIEVTEVDPGTEIEISRGSMIFGPEGWEPVQMKSEQPTTTYEMFKSEILNQIARCLNMPYNIAACNSKKYNYASGRLDHQTYFRSIDVTRDHMRTAVLNRVFRRWFKDALAVPGLLPYGAENSIKEIHWFWNGREHVDPAKEANAQASRLASMTTTLAAEYAVQGKDWETELRQLAKEKKLMAELGLQVMSQPHQAARPEDNEEDEEQDDE